MCENIVYKLEYYRELENKKITLNERKEDEFNKEKERIIGKYTKHISELSVEGDFYFKDDCNSSIKDNMPDLCSCFIPNNCNLNKSQMKELKDKHFIYFRCNKSDSNL